MMAEVNKILDDALPVLCDELDVQHGLFRMLQAHKVLTAEQVESCQTGETHAKMVENMLTCMKRRPLSAYISFREILSSSVIDRADLVEKYLPDLRSKGDRSADPKTEEIKKKKRRRSDADKDKAPTKRIAETNNIAQQSSGRTPESPLVPETTNILQQSSGTTPESPLTPGLKYFQSPKLADTSDFTSEGESQVFDDGKLCIKDPSIYVTGMTIITRKWNDRPIIGGLIIQYSSGKDIQHGSKARRGTHLELSQFELEEDERIVKAEVRAGMLVDAMTFYTNKNRQFGPYGGIGGHEYELKCPHGASYLAYVNGSIDIAEEETTLRNLQLVWGYELQDREAPIKTMKTEHYVICMAQIDERIFVLCRSSKAVKVFKLDYERLDDISLEMINRPNGIAACSDTKSLYVPDSDGKACWVWRLSVNGQEKVKKLLPNTPTALKTPAVSVRSGRLLATTLNHILLYTDELANDQKLPYMDELTLAVTIKPRDMSDIKYAAETSRNTIVFYHLQPRSQVVEVDLNGVVLREFSDQQRLITPTGLSFDSHGQIFVADFSKQHVLLLTKDLLLERIVLDCEHVELASRPRRLHYVPQTGQLMVSNFRASGPKDYVIQVFPLGQPSN